MLSIQIAVPVDNGKFYGIFTEETKEGPIVPRDIDTSKIFPCAVKGMIAEHRMIRILDEE